ncbi:zinc metalloprotease [Jiangella endophytica]|uniref:peptidase M50 n=1 Tax=Jiangella endophytica TaxID=1623398 RepID=UPI000E353B75|nr:peptidase M50 [Jiangella endophytica]
MTTVESDPAAGWLRQARPRLRDDVRVGPALAQGSADVHIVGDRATGAYVRVGAREAFLMSRLDGHRTLAEIGEDYADAFGRRLAVAHWQQLLGLLAGRGLMEPADDTRLAEVRERAAVARRTEGRSPLLWRLPVRGAAALVPSAARWFSRLLHPLAAAPLTLAGFAVVAASLLSWGELYAAFTGDWTVTVAAAVVTWLVICAHEFGHGVACHRYGGVPTEIGLMWRFPLIAPYCKVDDVVTFPRRSQRVMTSFAGVYVNLLALLPFAALWWWGPSSGWWHGLAGGLLLLGAVSTIANLIPVLKLDGYHMLEHATSTLHLQSESFRFAGAAVRGGAGEYPARLRVVYGAYLVVAVGILGTALVLAVRYWYLTLAGFWGPLWAVLFLAGEALVVAALLRWAVVWRRRKAEQT